MKRVARIDKNQPEIVKTFREQGLTVAITSNAHDGFPDIVIGYGLITVLVEIKDGSKPPSQRKLTKDQVKFHSEFTGAITVIENVSQAIQLSDTIKAIAGQVSIKSWDVGA